MRIIQTLYTKNIKSANLCGGWLTEEFSYICWALSCLNARKYYGNVELYTDSYGADILVDKLKLPYNKVHVVLEHAPILNDLPAYLWALSKIYTYSLQTEPFIHIDGDFVFWKKYNLNQLLMFQNVEYAVPLYKRIHDALKKDSGTSAFDQCLENDFVEGAFNMGLFGGTNLPLIREYAQNALSYASSNRFNQVFEENKNDINCFIEQYYAHYLVREGNIDHTVIHRPVKYQSKIREEQTDFNLRNKEIGFGHFLGQSKLNYYVTDFIKRELYENYPNYYEQIHRQFKDGKKQKFYFSKNNIQLNIDDLYNDLMTRLETSHYLIDDELKENYRQYLQDKKTLLNEVSDRNDTTETQSPIPSSINEWKTTTKVRLNDNFIQLKKYLCPWSQMYKAQKFVYKEDVVKASDIQFNKYCLFARTPFEKSLASIWVNGIMAYVISRILSTNYIEVSNILEKLNLLLKDNQKLPQRLLFLLLITINEYNIIDFSNE